MAGDAPIYVPNLKLPSGDDMPQVGLGLWKMPNETCAGIIYHAIKDGYRLFDGACDYGNEVESGQGIARAIKDGLVKREDLFIVSKLWNSFHDPERVEPICRKQLADWGIDYFDLYLIHFPVSSSYIDPAVRYPPGWFFDDAQTTFKPGNATLQQTWEAMEKLVEKGLCKNIGVSNYNASLLYDMMQYAKIKPATLQIEHHPYYVQEHLLTFCKEQGIPVTAYSSFGPQSFLDCDMKAAEKVRTLWENPVVNRIAKDHGKSPAQILLRWATQRGLAVIPKSNTHQRLRENLDVCSFDLTAEEIEELKGLDMRLKFNNPPNYGIPCYLFA